MPDTSATNAAELRELAHKLLALADKISPRSAAIDPIRSAEEVADLVAKRICLNCGERVAAGETYRRGLDSRCYQTTLRRGIPDSELVAAGIMAPATSGGRPPTRDNSAIDQYLQSKTKAIADGLRAENERGKKRGGK